MADTIRDVTIRISLKQVTGEKLRVPDLQATEQAAKKAADSMDQVAKAAEGVKESTKVAADEIKRLRELDEAKLKAIGVGDSFKAAGEGAFTLARGAAFLFSSTDEGFQKMLTNVAKVQGGFDLFKGSFETVKGLTEGLVKLKVATEAATVAEAIQIATTKGLTAAMATARGAAIAMWTALGPIGAIALAIAAAGTAIYLGWKWLTHEEKPKRSIRELREEMELWADQIAETAVAQKEAEQSFTRASQRNAILDKELELQKESARITGEQIDEEKEIEKLRKTASAQLSTQTSLANIAAGHSREATAYSQANVEILKARVAFQERIELLTDKQLQTEKARGDQLAKEKTEQEGLLKSVQDRIKAEKDALLTAEARFGQLSKREQQRVLDIGTRGGPQTRKEAELVSKAGFDQASTEFFAERGRGGGFQQASKLLGGKTDDDLRKLEQERTQIEERLDAVKGKITSNQQRQLSLIERVVEELEKVDKVEAQLAEMERKLVMRKAREEALKK